jgi:hypothetical protein
MALMIHDTTGTQTDCPKPLSRKKLRQLMPMNRSDLTAGSLKNSKNPFHIAGRVSGWKAVSAVMQKRRERQDKRKLFEKRSLPDGTTFQMLPNAVDLVDIKPTLFERVGGLFSKLRRQFEREKAKGK